MTQVRGSFPELNSNYKKPAKVRPLPIHKYTAAPAKPKAAPKRGK